MLETQMQTFQGLVDVKIARSQLIGLEAGRSMACCQLVDGAFSLVNADGGHGKLIYFQNQSANFL
jgi:hypothetical protein